MRYFNKIIEYHLMSKNWSNRYAYSYLGAANHNGIAYAFSVLRDTTKFTFNREFSRTYIEE